MASVCYKYLINGSPSNEIVVTRGLRQGDLLSTFLLMLYAEDQYASLVELERDNKILGIKVKPSSHVISHFFFADDYYIFLKVNTGEVVQIKECL